MFKKLNTSIDPSITAPQFIFILISVLVIGSFFSLGILRIFQKRIAFGVTSLILFLVLLFVFIYLVNVLPLFNP